jgi:hypothetical protein
MCFFFFGDTNEVTFIARRSNYNQPTETARLENKRKKDRPRPRKEHDLMCFFLLAVDGSQFVSQKKEKRRRKSLES